MILIAIFIGTNFLEKGNYVNPTRSSDDDFSDAYTDQYWEAYGAFFG